MDDLFTMNVTSMDDIITTMIAEVTNPDYLLIYPSMYQQSAQVCCLFPSGAVCFQSLGHL